MLMLKNYIYYSLVLMLLVNKFYTLWRRFSSTIWALVVENSEQRFNCELIFNITSGVDP